MERTLSLTVVLAGAILTGPTQAGETVQVAQLATKQDPGAAERAAFFDDFEGGELAKHWEVINPNPDNFIAEDGELLVVSGAHGLLREGSLGNLFKLVEPLPADDWTATLRVQLDAQTGKDFFVFVLYDDPDNFLGISAYTWFECCGYNAVLSARALKYSKGEETLFDRRIWTSKEASQSFSTSAESMPPFLLRFEKRRRSYYPAIKLEDGESDWIELERLVALRAEGGLAFALAQYEETAGESIAIVDWVRIEAAD